MREPTATFGKVESSFEWPKKYCGDCIHFCLEDKTPCAKCRSDNLRDYNCHLSQHTPYPDT